MKKVFENPSELENLVKQKLSIPPFLMMENAALFLSDFIIKIIKKNERINQIVIFCGKGNNGGDGFALARLLVTTYHNISVTLLVMQMPVTEEAKTQFEICKKLSIHTVLPDRINAFLENLLSKSQSDVIINNNENKINLSSWNWISWGTFKCVCAYIGYYKQN